MEKSSVDQEFFELMSSNGIDEKMQEVQNAYVAADELRQRRTVGGQEQEQKQTFGEKLMEKTLGPRADEMEKPGNKFWKNFVLTTLIIAGIICGLVAISM